jgi:integrase
LPFYRDHLLVQAGTGLRSGELLGLRGRRVDLALGRLEVVEVRYDAGRFGSGYKARPKSDTSIRPVPMAGLVVEAVRRRLEGCPPDGLVFCGPGGSQGVKRGVRSQLSVRNYRRAYRLAVRRAGLDGLDLHGPHDLRHTFATWLEDAGVPVRVIDELMGHRAARAGGGEARGSAIGVVYRHLTPEMQARVLAAVDECLGVALTALAAPLRPQRDDAGSAGNEGMAAQ